MATQDTELDEIRELLPWYLNGTLESDEAERVRRYLDEVQTEVEDTDALLKAIGEDVPVPMLTHERIAGVMSRLDSEPRRSRSILRRIGEWWRSGPTGRDYGALAAFAGSLALVAVLVLNTQPSQDGVYTTHSSERPEVAIQIEVAGDVGAAEVQALFDTPDVTVQQQGAGVFVVTLPEETSVSELYDTLQMLREDARVLDARALTDEE